MGGTSFAAAQVAGVAAVVAVLAVAAATAVVAFVAVELGDGVRNHVTVQCLVEFEVLEAGHRNPIPFVVDCLLPADVVPSAGDCWSARVNATPLGPVVVVAPPDGASRDSIDAEIAAMERDRRHDAA